MNYRQELQRLAQRLSRGQRRQHVEIATVADTSPNGGYGFVIARLIDGTPINVRTWSPIVLAVGQEVMVLRIGEQEWNWWTLVGVNASLTSTEPGGTPYTPPVIDPAAIGPHDVGGSLHTGNLPWERVDLTGSKPNLATDVEGVLPRGRQEPQIQKLVLETEITVGDGEMVAGSLAGCTMGLVRSVELTGGVAATLRFLDQPVGVEEYATVAATPTPFLDRALPFFHEDALRDGRFYYELSNDGSTDATFALTIVVMSMET
jgi:hypothetical protein